jgi:hypothetical protein
MKTSKGGTMEKMMAMCGLVCSGCPAFLATMHDSDEERRKTAEEWSKAYGHEIKPEDINCFGCLSVGKQLLAHCGVCEIRVCGTGKKVENCAHCPDYACEKLLKFFEMAPEAKGNLEGERKSL